MLYLVPTPVGNLGDMTYRAVEVLRGADVILAEDTRTSRPLLLRYGIDTPMQSHHIHNEHQEAARWVEQMKAGRNIAVITDAGTPGISDPGFLIVREAIKEGVEVECLPGATAFVPALVQSGLPCDKFVFLGFLPHKKGRHTALAKLADEPRTTVIYESPHRLAKLLAELQGSVGGARPCAVCREISKVHAETFRGTVEECLAHFSSKEVRGEIVVVLGGGEG